MAREKPEPAFLHALAQVLGDDTFVKLSLSHYKGKEEGLKQVHIRPIIVKRQPVLSFTYRYKTRDIVKNYPFDEAQSLVRQWLSRDFMTATLFTTKVDLAFDGIKGTIKTSAPTHKAADLNHDRAKTRQVDAKGDWLHLLGITDHDGKVRKDAQDKYRQIDKYIETLSAQLKHIDTSKGVRVADMGAGKGYLTFALYDYLTNKLGVKAQVTGVEYRADLVDLCNRIRAECGFSGPHFVQGTIDSYDASGTNVLIALHACDTATDDAIAKGIKAGAELIVVAPCCHKQIRREMEKAKTGNDLDFLLKHGTFMERHAEMVTDGLRALLLEYEGYSTKVFEFISDAHTPRNVMIVGVRNPKAKRHDAEILKKIGNAKAFHGIGRHHLEGLLIQASDG